MSNEHLENEQAESNDPLDRTPRSLEEREASMRTTDTYIPQGMLPVPKPSDGYGFRWVRTAIHGQQDNINVSQKFREEWVPCKAVDHPEIYTVSDIDMRPEFEGNIEIGGLMLCKAPMEFILKRDEYYANLAGRQIQGIDENYMRISDPIMPILKPSRKSRTEFGGG